MPDLTRPAGDSDFYFVPAEDPETAVQRNLELVKIRSPKRPTAALRLAFVVVERSVPWVCLDEKVSRHTQRNRRCFDNTVCRVEDYGVKREEALG